MNKAIDEILKQYPFIGDDIRKAQEQLNKYIQLREDLKSREPLKATRITGEGHGYDVSDPTYNYVENVMDKYAEQIKYYTDKVNELIDRQKWLDKAYASLTEDERRIVCLRYNDRWQTWKIMRRMGILDREKFYRLLNSAKDKVKKIMFT